MLFIPREAKRPEHRVMTREEVKHLFTVLESREKLIAKLAILAGMRTGEIFALKWKALADKSAHVTQRVYHGDIDTPKTHHSVRKAALADGLSDAIQQWREQSPLTGPEDWVFPSEANHHSSLSLPCLGSRQAAGSWARLGHISGDATDPQLFAERSGREP